MSATVSQSQNSQSSAKMPSMAPVVMNSNSMNPTPNSTMMTMTNSTPIMSTKAETGDQNRAPGGVGGDQPRTLGPVDQTRTPGLKDLPHTILAAKPCPIALPTQPTLGPHRPLIEEIRPNPIESPAVAPVFPCPLCVGFFFTLAAMKNHLEAEHRKYQCDICRKLMSHKRNVDRHRKSVHENQRGFGCPICVYKSAHKQVVQRHLQTKHQIKREESPPIPYHPSTAPDGTNSSMLDIKPPPFLNYPYYAHPPWLGQVGQHDYHGYYQHQGQYSNYVMEAQQNLANHMGMNNSNPMPQQNMMFTPAAASAEKAETTMVPNSMAPVPDNSNDIAPPMTTPTSMPPASTSPAIVPAVSGSTTTITKNDTITNANNIDENANDVQTNEAGKKPQLSAEVSFEENHVRIVFQRGMSIHVVEVPFPEI